MERGAWWATVHGVARVRDNLVTKPSRGFQTSVAGVKKIIFNRTLC